MGSSHQDYLAWTYFGDRAFDRAEFSRLHELLGGITRFIDVGASHGVYSYHANRILENAEILCIEADPERFAVLQENGRKWESGSTNRFRFVNAAASDFQDRDAGAEITFYTTGTQISGGLFAVEERSDGYSPCRVPVVCLDDYFEPGQRTFIKIDVEGGEFRVLKGARRFIESGLAVFFTELSWWGDRDRGTTAFGVLRFAAKAGLRVDRRLKSDYLFSPEPRAAARVLSVLRCVPPLLIRYAWGRFVPRPVRIWRERRQNRRRIASYESSVRQATE